MVWLGSKKQCAEMFLNFVWKMKVKILGVYFCNDNAPRVLRKIGQKEFKHLHGKKLI